MTLTVGTGPFGQSPAGQFNFSPPAEISYLEDWPRWMRARLGGETVADSKQAKLLHRSGVLPVLLFPEEDVRLELIPDAALTRHEDLVELDWQAMDEWLEEDEVAFGHVRDPFHRLDVRPSSRKVRVSVDGETLAESDRTVALFETSLPTRWYFPPEDVNNDVLEPSETRTVCAYKGRARTYSTAGVEDVAWSYDEPVHEFASIQGRVAFYDEIVDVELDGEPQQRPRTRFK